MADELGSGYIDGSTNRARTIDIYAPRGANNVSRSHIIRIALQVTMLITQAEVMVREFAVPDSDFTYRNRYYIFQNNCRF